MATLTEARLATNRKSSARPLNVSLLLTIRETDYSVTPIAPGPDNVKAYRLEKLSGDRETYDLAHTNDGLVTCDCRSYVSTHEGTISTCKHGSALVLMGLLPKPCCVANAQAAPLPAPVAAEPKADRWAGLAEELAAEPKPAEPAPYAEHLAKLDAIAAAEAVVKGEAEAPAPKAPAFDRDIYRAQNAVAAGTALWLSHRHLHTSEPLPTPEPSEPRLVDDDGTALETRAEMAKRHRDEHAALVAVSELRADWLVDKPSEAECCSDEEPMPCAGCLLGEGPSDLADDGWRDDERWTVTEPEPRTLEEQVRDHAAELRAQGSPLGDLLAEKAEQLADEIRYLDASTVAMYRDRREAALDVARDAAEARNAARCC